MNRLLCILCFLLVLGACKSKQSGDPAGSNQAYMETKSVQTASSDAADSKRQNCSEVESSIDDGLNNLRKVARADEMDDAQRYAKKAANDFDDAENAAEDCGCTDAASSLSDAAMNARRASRADQLDECWTLANKAKKLADESLETVQSFKR